jgi:hypothetical protein
MITLHSFGPGFGLPDPSPFCIKAEILLRMSGLPFQRVTGNMRSAPKSGMRKSGNRFFALILL